MTRRFNVAGPCVPSDHYMIPALARLPEAPELVDEKEYFVVHAPRQTGKTTALRALARELTAQGRYAALHVTCEVAEAAGDDHVAAQRVILSEMRLQAHAALPVELRPAPWPDLTADNALRLALAAWAESCPRPLVLFFDEIDSLSGQSLISILRQLRAGFPDRPRLYPSSVVLCGVADVRDYKAAAGSDLRRTGTASPFNVKVKSLRLGDFTLDEVAELYGQHTAETGQQFAPGVCDYGHELTGGQPWLVNALAREVVHEMRVPLSETITKDHFDRAKERLILARATHLDSLAARLAEPRVRRIIAPLIAGDPLVLDPYDDDLTYVRDLGLIAPQSPVRAANPIYREVIVRVLSASIQESVTANPRSFVRTDGSFDLPRVLDEFTDWWVENGEFLVKSGYYHEVAPQLILMGYLQRVVNGGGFVSREYAVGRGRIDLQIRWPYTPPGGRPVVQREAIEIKTWAAGRSNPQPQGLRQLDRYLDRLRLDTGVLAIFDQRPRRPSIEKRTRITKVASPSGRIVTLLHG